MSKLSPFDKWVIIGITAFLAAAAILDMVRGVGEPVGKTIDLSEQLEKTPGD